MLNQNHKVQKYTHKLKYAKNNQERDFYGHKLQQYKIMYGGSPSNVSNDVSESISSLGDIFIKTDSPKIKYDKKQVDEKIKQLKSESEDWLKGLNMKFTESELIKSENEILKKNQQVLTNMTNQLAIDKKTLLDNNKKMAKQLSDRKDNTFADFTLTEDFLSTKSFLRDIIDTETGPHQ